MKLWNFRPFLFLCFALLSPFGSALADTPPPTFTGHAAKMQLLDLLSDPILVNDLYLKNRITRVVSIADDGAVGANIEWEQKKSPKFFIEEQREGADMIQAGVALKDTKLIDKGIKVLDWGFNHQADSGEFPETRDAVHSVSFFVEAVSRSILLLEQGRCGYDAKIQQWLPKLQKAAQWMIPASANEASRIKDLYPFTHRYYILGAGLAQTALLLHDNAMAAVATDYIRLGLKQQQPDGINPERGGFDAGYQCYGMSLACHYTTICSDPALEKELREMALKGLGRVLTQVQPDGTVDITSSTRLGKEKDRQGHTKVMNYRFLTQVLVWANRVTGDPMYRDLAEKTAPLAEKTAPLR